MGCCDGLVALLCRIPFGNTAIIIIKQLVRSRGGESGRPASGLRLTISQIVSNIYEDTVIASIRLKSIFSIFLTNSVLSILLQKGHVHSNMYNFKGIIS
jgi:hypothetical protein